MSHEYRPLATSDSTTTSLSMSSSKYSMAVFTEIPDSYDLTIDSVITCRLYCAIELTDEDVIIVCKVNDQKRPVLAKKLLEFTDDLNTDYGERSLRMEMKEVLDQLSEDEFYQYVCLRRRRGEEVEEEVFGASVPFRFKKTVEEDEEEEDFLVVRSEEHCLREQIGKLAEMRQQLQTGSEELRQDIASVMATNRVIVDEFGRQFSANSMDRFGDDLTELIVSYLSFVDKTRLEGVSKRWRRLMDYNPIKTLKISRESDSFKVIEGSEDSLVFNWRSDAEEDYNHLKKLFDKCTNIRKIVFNDIAIDCSLIAVIAEYCHRLDSLKIIGSQMSEEVSPLFGSQLGPKVKQLEFDFEKNQELDENQVVANCPLIESLKCRSFSVFSDSSDDFLPKLKSLDTNIDANNVSLFPDFVHKYQKQMKSLSLKISTTELIDILNAISLLEDINDLVINVIGLSEDIELLVNIDRQLQQIGRNCRQLKRFFLDIFDVRIEGNIWRNFVDFQALKSMSLMLNTTVDQSMASMGLKKNLKRIFIIDLEAKEEMIANIHQFVPNLKSFAFWPKTEVTDKLLDSLSQLKHLKDIFIFPMEKKPKITESGVNRLLANCPKLTRFYGRDVAKIEVYKQQKSIIYWNKSSDTESE